MKLSIPPETFSNLLNVFLEETFETHHGIYLDKNNALFATLDTISAEEASVPVGGKCASLAAQVAHTTFYIESFERYAFEGDDSPRDWGDIWRRVEKVNAEEWQEYKNQLRAAYGRMQNVIRNNPDWNEDAIGGVLGVIVHSAYHLGEIRQAMCTLKA
ncbi:MAG: DinB family protein [Anaerolineales bacterium]|jgi:hypothetical protein|nr:DinB family protein [Anaerolineales bacterium]